MPSLVPPVANVAPQEHVMVIFLLYVGWMSFFIYIAIIRIPLGCDYEKNLYARQFSMVLRN